MAKEPWEEDIYEENKEELTRKGKKSLIWANRILTILAIIFFIIVIAIAALLFYLSSGGSNTETATQGFYSTSVVASTDAAAAESSVATEEAADTTQESTTEETAGTITVLAGEGEASIAARAGISIAQLEALNPSHMTQGYWYANPGDVVKIQ